MALIIKVEIKTITWPQALQATRIKTVITHQDIVWVVFVESQLSQNYNSQRIIHSIIK